MADNTAKQQIAPVINRLIAVVIQVQDVNRAVKVLRKLGLVVTEVQSTGAFLARRNSTLLVGLHESQIEEAIEAIHSHCRQRVEYISTPLEGAPLPIPISTPVTVGGAIVFAFDVDHYEEF